MTEHARAVVIGGGVGGTSIAYHFAERGWRDVVLVERADLTSGSTFHSAGLVGQLRSSVTLTKMMMYGVDLYPAGPFSAYRSYAQQLYLYEQYLSGQGNLAAVPGTSSHEYGIALDLADPSMRTVIDEIGSRYGWAKTEASSEWWHVNYVGA